ncbi:MAG: sigma-70 family RNA polymerase sigma factor [Planctomycetes bacterium]|nr:sigma-70 family RNA polymerase sigma factor [Planctomycetota bacterium]MCB9917649.1 sigma-70 family RNA polymerase sigma factor [Planctomycetota bacterium]
MDGSGTSAEWIFERFTPLVEAQVRMRLGTAARSADVEDIVSDTWVVVLQKMGELSPRGGRFAPVLLKFLGTTAIQLCNNHLRRMIRTNMRHATPGVATSTSSDPMAELARRTLGVLTRVGRNETMEAVREALATLEDDKRHLLVLRLVEGHSNQEIADILDEKPNTIAVRYRRALDALRDVLPQQVLHDILGM